MKKIFVVVVLAAMVVGVATAKKNKEVAAPAATTAGVQLNSSSDSISYAAGYAHTNGLIPYLQQQLNVDTAYMADFIQGLKDAKEKSNDPRFTAYMVGGQIAQMIDDRMISNIKEQLTDTPVNFSRDMFYNGFLASLANDTASFKQTDAENYFRTNIESVIAAKNEKLKKEGQDWLAENAKKSGVITTASGLQYKVLTMGTGARPKADQEVTVKYEGHLINGKEFDSSYKRKDQTTKFKCNRVIKGWTEGLQLMPVGSKFEFYIPYELAYGERGQGNMIPPYATLIFTVELVDITADAPKPAAPAKPAAKKPAAKKK